MMVNHSPGPVDGPMAPYMTGFREVLDAHGSARKTQTSQQLVALIMRLDRWLQRKGLRIGSLDDQYLQLLVGASFKVTIGNDPADRQRQSG